MSKSILIIDTPESCRECPAYEYNVPSSTCYCNAVHDDIGYARPARKLNKPAEYNFPIPDWCPLTSLPLHKDLSHYIQRGDSKSMIHTMMGIYDSGYNQCLDDLQKGASNEK